MFGFFLRKFMNNVGEVQKLDAPPYSSLEEFEPHPLKSGSATHLPEGKINAVEFLDSLPQGEVKVNRGSW